MASRVAFDVRRIPRAVGVYSLRFSEISGLFEEKLASFAVRENLVQRRDIDGCRGRVSRQVKGRISSIYLAGKGCQCLLNSKKFLRPYFESTFFVRTHSEYYWLAFTI